MTWRDNLSDASWRGVPCWVDESSWTAGRNTVTHEFPQRNKPYVEDLGRSVREFTIKAWIIANEANNYDYIPQRDQLIAALEKSGSGTLVHPLYGELQGFCKGEITESTNVNGGYAQFNLTFTESGDLDFRSISVTDTLGDAFGACNSVLLAAANDFNKIWDVQGFTSFVIESAADIVVDVSRVFRVVQNLANADISTWQQALTNLDSSGILKNGFEVANNISMLQRQVKTLFNPKKYVVASSQSTTPARMQQQANTNAINMLNTIMYVSEYARRSADLSSGSDRYSVDSVSLRGSPQLLSRQDLNALRSDVMTQITEVIYDISDAGTFETAKIELVKMRSAVIAHMTTEGENLGNTYHDSFSIEMPAIVIAYKNYGVLRDDEIIARNEIPNPLFVLRNSNIELVSDV